MPKRVKRADPVPKTVLVPAPQPIEAPVPMPVEREAEAPKKKRGRPSKAEREARLAAEREANMLTPEQTLDVTRSVLMLCSVAAKGERATDQEVTDVNGPMNAVLNKYGGRMPYMEESMLLLSIVQTTRTMRGRAREKGLFDASRDSDKSRTERLGENHANPLGDKSPVDHSFGGD